MYSVVFSALAYMMLQVIASLFLKIYLSLQCTTVRDLSVRLDIRAYFDVY